ncbi:hypothetical protein AC579_2500 [Pseudocercospora musae]|uniref:Uncharacterized protein n=1 Tax=Pseudocercospora musae TaxID=113226 RepID=A0A139IFC3_9PEZI|nr:hypothetical protein AC579_2500 [Pseudocercospora musae]
MPSQAMILAASLKLETIKPDLWTGSNKSGTREVVCPLADQLAAPTIGGPVDGGEDAAQGGEECFQGPSDDAFNGADFDLTNAPESMSDARANTAASPPARTFNAELPKRLLAP